MMVRWLATIVADYGLAGETVLADWNNPVELGDLPWEQSVQQDDYIGADWAGILARGNVTRSWTFRTRRVAATSAELYALVFDMDTAWEPGRNVTLDVFLRDPDQPTGEAEVYTAMDYTRYTASVAAIERVTPTVDPETMSVEFAFQVRLGALVLHVAP